MSSIYVSDELKNKLIGAARRRGYAVARGRQSQLAEYLAYLVKVDEQTGTSQRKRNTLEQALGLASVPGKPPPSDIEVEEMLTERRMRK